MIVRNTHRNGGYETVVTEPNKKKVNGGIVTVFQINTPPTVISYW